MKGRRSILKLLLGLPTVPMVIREALQAPPKRDMDAIIDKEAERLTELFGKARLPMDATCSVGYCEITDEDVPTIVYLGDERAPRSFIDGKPLKFARPTEPEIDIEDIWDPYDVEEELWEEDDEDPA